MSTARDGEGAVDRITPAIPDARADAAPAIRTALLDDHEILLDSMSVWIMNNAPDLDLVVSASTWMELVTSTAFPTALVIMDFQLKEPISIEARIRTCRAAGAAVVVLTALDDDESRRRALDSGAVAFLSKSLPMQDVIAATRAAAGLGLGSSSPTQWRPLPIGAEAQPRPKLSAGELEALRLYVAGESTGDVAQKMNVQYETAKTYIRRVREKYAKVGRPASKKADLIRRAAEDGLLE